MTLINQSKYERDLLSFPTDITFDEYKGLTIESVREDIISRNKILKTDTYNRTMTETAGEKKYESAAYTLSCRRSPNGHFNVIAGIRRRIKDLFTVPITQEEVQFAEDYYAEVKSQGGNGLFNRELRQSVIDKHSGYLPIDVYAVDDGTVQTVGEPTLRVESEYSNELAALYEPLFLRIFYESAVATDAAFLEELLGAGRVVESGNRSAINDSMHFTATKSTYIGGGITHTSNDAAAALHPQLMPTGTLAHRYFASYETEDEAMRNAVEKNQSISLLADFADSYSGINKIIALKQEFPEKNITPRLDSGDMVHQALYAIEHHIEAGLTDPKRDFIVISDIGSIEDIYKIEQAVRDAGHDPKQWIKYGMGSILIAQNKTRSAMSAAYKLTEIAKRAVGKTSNTPAKEPIPGRINVEVRDTERVIVQEDEPVQGERLLKQVVKGGQHLFDDNDSAAVDRARTRRLETFASKDLPVRKSDRTIRIQDQVRAAIAENIR